MDLSQVARADHGHVKRFHAALLRSRAPAVLALLLILDEAQQLADLRHQLVVAAQDVAGMVQADLGADTRGGALRPGFQSLRARNSFRFSATTLMQRGRVGCPSTSMKGGTSCNTRLMPDDEAVAVRSWHSGERPRRRRSRHDRECERVRPKASVGDDDMISQAAIVGHMAAGHEEIVVADRGDAVFLFGWRD